MRKLTCLRQVPMYVGAYPVKWNISVAGGIESNIREFLSEQMLCIMFRIYSERWCASAIMFRKKFLAIPLVAASEAGRAQTIRVYMNGVVGRKHHLVEKSYKLL